MTKSMPGMRGLPDKAGFVEAGWMNAIWTKVSWMKAKLIKANLKSDSWMKVGSTAKSGSHFIFYLTIVALMMLLSPSLVAAMPTGSQSWTEEPWTDTVSTAAQETKETALSDPITSNLSNNEPRYIVLGDYQYNFSDYFSQGNTTVASASPELWIRKDDSWCRYVQSIAGDEINLIAHSSKDASCDLYLISYSNSTIAHWNFKFLADYYYRLTLVPEETGRLFLLLTQGSEPGNALILDVSPRQIEQLTAIPNISDIKIGEALITIKSQRIRGYDVYVDGVFFASDSSDGSLDGTASLTVGGEKTHTITVSERDGKGNLINKSEHTKVFKRDTSYTLWIE